MANGTTPKHQQRTGEALLWCHAAGSVTSVTPVAHWCAKAKSPGLPHIGAQASCLSSPWAAGLATLPPHPRRRTLLKLVCCATRTGVQVTGLITCPTVGPPPPVMLVVYLLI